MGTADIHIHSEHSDGMASVSQIFEYVEHSTTLDLIAITDHDMFDGAEEALRLAANGRFRFQVLAGMEVTTLEGHLLLLGISKPVRSLQRLDQTIAQVHAQGGYCIVPHPMSWLIRSVGRRGLLRLHANRSSEVYFDGFETLNPSIAGRVTHSQARALNRSHLHLAETGGSDAHTLELIGTGVTRFPGSSAGEFIAGLRSGATTGEGHFWTSAEVRQLARIGPQQMYRALVQLPARHARRALARIRYSG